MATGKAPKVRTLDFTDVREQGGFNTRRKEPGEYRARIVAIEETISKSDNKQWVFTIQIDGDRRASYPYYCGFDAKTLWKLRNLIVACGLKAPSGRAKIDPQKLVNRALGVFLDDDEYEGRVKSTVQDVFPVGEGEFLNDGESSSKKAKGRKPSDDDEDDEEDDEEEVKPAKKSSKKRPEPEDDDEDEDEDEEDEDPPAKKKSSGSRNSRARSKSDDDEDEDDDDEDEDDAPPKKSPKKAAKKATKKAKKPADDDDDDDMDIDDL